MTFDIHLAIAAQGGAHASDWHLRDRYPELAFLFDELADLREALENLPLGFGNVRDIAEEYTRENDRAEGLAEALMDTRDRLDQIADVALRDGGDAETVLNTLAEIREWVDSAIGRDA